MFSDRQHDEANDHSELGHDPHQGGFVHEAIGDWSVDTEESARCEAKDVPCRTTTDRR